MSDARFVGVTAKVLTHAVWVPDTLTDTAQYQFEFVSREGRGRLVRARPQWSGHAECGQYVTNIIAGPNHGHDWDLVPSRDKCLKCERVIERRSRLHNE